METKNVEVSQKKSFFRFFFVGLISLFFYQILLMVLIGMMKTGILES